MYVGHHKKPTIVLEVVASYDLWIWHAFFGLPGSHNDINVLHRSPVFDDLVSGNTPAISFTVHNREYNMGYYLADDIYPDWATLVKGISMPTSRKQKVFTTKVMEYRKDVERAFGVLQAKYAIIKGPSRLWDPEDLQFIMYFFIILHNMGVEDERGLPTVRNDEYEGYTPPSIDHNHNVPPIAKLIAKRNQLESRPAHRQLVEDLVEHVWANHGAE